MRASALIRHEMAMSLRRPAFWVAYALLFVFHTVILFAPPPVGEWAAGDVIGPGEIWPASGRFLVALNVFFPVLAGILSADRMRRDLTLGMREIQASTSLSPAAYVLTKYAGVLASYLLPLFAWAMAIPLVMAALGHADAGMLYTVPVAFVAITVPAFAFVVAFSIACPLAMPQPVYQVLFTGYWFWANFVPPKLFPTLNGTLLTPSGMFAMQGFFGGAVSEAVSGPKGFGPVDAALNLAVLATCVAIVLALLTLHVRRQARLA